ncbi:PTS lactose/cellobiose transporter subunit IIA [Pectobacteriaceae bacterium CE70]|uniref:PTS lactose/cellobiose transporter subunit IIA n=1 Tax=Serratia sp. (strain ATCC 39006) TaxID=104623 RepID=A0A2I5T9V3_SERS3|nr:MULTISPECIES: PTS lactose/cellobiose transporter subunit IIA [Enterobacterales]WJV64057.1 PTS lactose/cellobiose transporter subunit IIA [Pectobacteriaceae bacterium C52]WJV68469.1 PTS lactose/cellobiose transporter subunit IIA [Pectobacteriaceae bacterium CE70]WJY12399.1 PTS lactose/cellobiose transporter subunit IIA [Pectobacteriaceae bacterium C80]WJY13660.1 PTS lactose/cellobiose transporter subunit IIA [Pectobacteriaceae bacterium CE90]AUH01324.1 PTS lactose/cellobiose transporter subu
METNSVLDEEYLMNLLCQAGAAKSAAMDAIFKAREGSHSEALHQLQISDEIFKEVHKCQTELISMDEGKGKIQMTLILTHIQDHIMNGMLCKEIATELVELYRQCKEKQNA